MLAPAARYISLSLHLCWKSLSLSSSLWWEHFHSPPLLDFAPSSHYFYSLELIFCRYPPQLSIVVHFTIYLPIPYLLLTIYPPQLSAIYCLYLPRENSLSEKMLQLLKYTHTQIHKYTPIILLYCIYLPPENSLQQIMLQLLLQLSPAFVWLSLSLFVNYFLQFSAILSVFCFFVCFPQLFHLRRLLFSQISDWHHIWVFSGLLFSFCWLSEWYHSLKLPHLSVCCGG